MTECEESLLICPKGVKSSTEYTARPLSRAGNASQRVMTNQLALLGFEGPQSSIIEMWKDSPQATATNSSQH